MVIILTFLVGALLVIDTSRSQTVELRYALFTAGPAGSFDSSGVVPAIELAEELINADGSILSGYNLTHTPVADTMCDRDVTLSEYSEVISPPNPTVLGLLGSGCSEASIATAEIVHHNNLSQVSYASASVELSDRSSYPNFFRTIPTDLNTALAIAAVLQFCGWRRVAFITQEEGPFNQGLTAVRDVLKTQGFSVRNVNASTTTPTDALNDTQIFTDEDYRIIFINTQANVARQIICEAYWRRYTYPRYVWLTYGWYQDRWWTEEINPELTNCTDDQLAEFLHRTLAVQLLSQDNSTLTTDTGLTLGEFHSHYEMSLNTPQAQANNYTYTPFASSAFDALWTLALALNSTSEMVHSLTREEILSTTQCEGTELVPLENFSYSNQLMGCIIRWNLERTDFVGVSGRVTFNSNGSRLQFAVQIFQYRLLANSLSRILIGQAIQENESTAEFVYAEGEDNESVFPSSEGGVPSDGTPIELFVTYHPALVALLYALCIAGFVFTTACLIFNFTQRNKKVVKLTSPIINYFIILGAYMQYLTTIFVFVPSTDPTTVYATKCIMSALLSIPGYCFGYAAVLAKMGRIYYIFSNPTANKKVLKDWKLIMVVLCIAGFGTLLPVLQAIIPPLQLVATEQRANEFGDNTRNEFGIRVEHIFYQCQSPGFSNIPQAIWTILIYLYIAILQVVGIILAVKTRKVKIRLLNDWRIISSLIYTSSIALVLIAIIGFGLAEFPIVGQSITSIGLVCVSTLFLVLIFVPKMVSLYRDPLGERVFETTNPSHRKPSSNNDRHYSASISRPVNTEETENGKEISNNGQTHVASETAPTNGHIIQQSHVASETAPTNGHIVQQSHVASETAPTCTNDNGKAPIQSL